MNNFKYFTVLLRHISWTEFGQCNDATVYRVSHLKNLAFVSLSASAIFSPLNPLMSLAVWSQLSQKQYTSCKTHFRLHWRNIIQGVPFAFEIHDFWCNDDAMMSLLKQFLYKVSFNFELKYLFFQVNFTLKHQLFKLNYLIIFVSVFFYFIVNCLLLKIAL